MYPIDSEFRALKCIVMSYTVLRSLVDHLFTIGPRREDATAAIGAPGLTGAFLGRY